MSDLLIIGLGATATVGQAEDARAAVQEILKAMGSDTKVLAIINMTSAVVVKGGQS